MFPLIQLNNGSYDSQRTRSRVQITLYEIMCWKLRYRVRYCCWKDGIRQSHSGNLLLVEADTKLCDPHEHS
jgi:hypothetical protein